MNLSSRCLVRSCDELKLLYFTTSVLMANKLGRLVAYSEGLLHQFFVDWFVDGDDVTI